MRVKGLALNRPRRLSALSALTDLTCTGARYPPNPPTLQSGTLESEVVLQSSSTMALYAMVHTSNAPERRLKMR